MSTPRVSIISPTFNHEAFIAECVESVIRQSFKDWEMIIIDDCSTDRTPEIVKRYADADPRIRVVRHVSNWGMHRLTESHDEGLSQCRGEYVALLEGDDLWAPEKLKLQVDAMDRHPTAVLCHAAGARVAGSKVRPIPFRKYSLNVLENKPQGAIFQAFLAGANPVVSQTVMIRKTALQVIGGFQPKNYELFLIDYPTWMHLALKGGFVFVPQILGYWRQHPSQITAAYNEKLFEDQLSYIDFFLKTHSSELSRLDVELEPFKKYPGYFALHHLVNLKLLAGKTGEAGEVFKKLKRIKKHTKLSLGDLFAYLKLSLRKSICGVIKN